MKPMTRLIDGICILLCASGVLIGLAFAAALILADAEAAFYFFDPTNLTPGFIKTLRCPPLITTSEYGQISVTFNNRTDRVIKPFARLNLANAEGISRTTSTQEAVAPGKSISYEWKVSHNDAYRNNILVQVIQTPLYPNPAAQASCGIWIVNLPAFTGIQITICTVLVSLLLVIFSLLFYTISHHPLTGNAKQTITTIGIILAALVVTLVIAFLGVWFLGLISCLISILIISSKVLFRHN